jgi:hypothetical protein
MSLRELHKNANSASRTKDSVQLYSCDDLRQVALAQAVEDAWVTGAVQVRYWARDILPWG